MSGIHTSSNRALDYSIPAMTAMHKTANPLKFLGVFKNITDMELVDWKLISQATSSETKIVATNANGSLVVTFTKERPEYRSRLLLEINIKDEDLYGVRSYNVILDPTTFMDPINTLIWQKASEYFKVFHRLAVIAKIQQIGKTKAN